jgi:NAD(P)-dependent dehydrogenase (short-subunit alcohol dehydrogenase family)
VRIGVAGAQSAIAREFCRLLPAGCEPWCDRLTEMPESLDRYLICTGYLAGKAVSCISREEADLTFWRNFVEPARFCDRVFLQNPKARICLIGSESGYSGSFDMSYAAAKAGLHLYVETKRLEHPDQQLVAIAPTVIWDSGMTERRTDLEAVKRRFAATRHGRCLTAAEVAAQACNALFIARPMLSGTVIRLGADAR